MIADRGHHEVPRLLRQFGLDVAPTTYFRCVDPADPHRHRDRHTRPWVGAHRQCVAVIDANDQGNDRARDGIGGADD